MQRNISLEVAGGQLMITPLSERPELTARAIDLNDAVWPTFIDATYSSQRFWMALYDEASEFQLVATLNNEVVACGHTIPLWWDGTYQGLPVGWDDALAQGVLRRRAQAPANTLCALAVSIGLTARGQRLSPIMIAAMKELCGHHLFGAFILPVRPTEKKLYPYMSMDEYLQLRREDGALVDPWLRTHERAGGRILQVAHRSMVVEGNRQQWREWTGLTFPDDAEDAIIDHALSPVQIAGDHVLYEEPNVWMAHRLDHLMHIQGLACFNSYDAAELTRPLG
jgi:hypothetical protein